MSLGFQEPLEALAAAAAERSPEPWIFYRPEWDWRWQSYGRAADRVARTIRRWHGKGVCSVGGRPLEIPPGMRPEDQAAAILAAEALGLPLAYQAGSSVRELRWDGHRLELVPGRGALESASLESLRSLDFQDADSGPGSNKTRSTDPFGNDAVFSSPWIELTRSLFHLCPENDSLPCRRPMVLAQPELFFPVAEGWGMARRRSVSTFSLCRDAAWILEPESEAFLPTVLWSRPTHLLLTFEGLQRLLGEWTKRRRKESRLRRVILWIQDGDEVDPSWSERLDAEVLPWNSV